jgi:hypothetical protein
MVCSPLKPSSDGPWLNFTTLLNWSVDLHSLCRVSVCRFIPSVCVCVCVRVCVCVGTYLVSTKWVPTHTQTE